MKMILFKNTLVNLQNILIDSFLKLTLKGNTELHYKINVENIETPEQYTQFDIIESEKTKGEIFVSPDLAEKASIPIRRMLDFAKQLKK